MGSTCAIDKDENICASYQDKALCKRQFAIDIYFNRGEDDQRDSYASLVCKIVLNSRRKKVE